MALHKFITILPYSLRCLKPSSTLRGSSPYNPCYFSSAAAAPTSRLTSKNAIGRVCHVTGHIVDVSFEEGLPPMLTALQVLDHSSKLILEVGQHLSETVVRTVAMNETKGLATGQRVINTGSPICVPVGRSTLGRMINAIGDPIDNHGPLDTEHVRPIHEELPSILENEEIPLIETDGETIYDAEIKIRSKRRAKEKKILDTGIKVLDLLAPFLRGGTIGLSAGDGVEKLTLAMELMHNFSKTRGGLCVFAGIGEDSQDGYKLYDKMVESHLIKLGDNQQESKCAIVYGQMNESPAARARVFHSGLSVAEHFRDCGQDVLLYVDNVLNLAEANSEVSALIGPSAVGYQPTICVDFKRLQKRVTTNIDKKSSITCVQFNPLLPNGDNVAPPIFARCDSEVMMCSKLHGLGIFPAIDPLTSTSRTDPTILDDRHFEVASRVRRLLKKYKNLQDMIAALGTSMLTEHDKETIVLARKVQFLLTQPFHVAEVFTGVPGKYVELEETIDSFEALLDGKYDHLPEESFKMVGGIKDAVKKAEKLEQFAASSQHYE